MDISYPIIFPLTQRKVDNQKKSFKYTNNRSQSEKESNYFFPCYCRMFYVHETFLIRIVIPTPKQYRVVQHKHTIYTAIFVENAKILFKLGSKKSRTRSYNLKKSFTIFSKLYISVNFI